MQLQYIHRFSFYKLPLGINGNVHNRSCLHNCLRSRHRNRRHNFRNCIRLRRSSFNHFLNFFVCSRTALGNLAHESQIFTGQRMVHIHHYCIGFYFNYTTIQALAF